MENFGTVNTDIEEVGRGLITIKVPVIIMIMTLLVMIIIEVKNL